MVSPDKLVYCSAEERVMAKRVQSETIGVDVSKDELWIARSGEAPVERIGNQSAAIVEWLQSLMPNSRIAVEATNTYHLALAEEAHRQGHRVYLVDGYRLNRYRESVGGRAKTDRSDARLLRRYLLKEGDDLRAWQPPSKAYTQVHRLLHRRAKLVQVRGALKQSLQAAPALHVRNEFKVQLKELLQQLKRLELLIEKQLRDTVREVQWSGQVQRCEAVEGIGPLTAIALTNAFHRGDFSHSDAFIAFLGLDVKVRDSGRQKGRRKLTKKGDPELRRLLHNAAMAARRSTTWEPFYQRYIQRGLAPTQALVILARKLARVAFALLKNQSTYQPAMAQ